MSLSKKSQIMSSDKLSRSLRRIAHEIVERNSQIDKIVLIGIKRRGVPLAERLAEHIWGIEGVRVPVGTLDTTPYRDDLEKTEKQLAGRSRVDFLVEGKIVIIVDDVLYTGRTLRAALDAIIDFGRPDCIQLAVLIDRGHREIPIRPDFVGKNVPTSKDEVVLVKVNEIDDIDEVTIQKKEPN